MPFAGVQYPPAASGCPRVAEKYGRKGPPPSATVTRQPDDIVTTTLLARHPLAITTFRHVFPSHHRSRPQHSQPPSRTIAPLVRHAPYIRRSGSIESQGGSSRRRFDRRTLPLRPGATCFPAVPRKRAA